MAPTSRERPRALHPRACCFFLTWRGQRVPRFEVGEQYCSWEHVSTNFLFKPVQFTQVAVAVDDALRAGRMRCVDNVLVTVVGSRVVATVGGLASNSLPRLRPACSL